MNITLPYPSITKRSRRWEKKSQSHKVVYRGVDPKLALHVKTIASHLYVPAGEVAHAVIKYALNRYELGELELNPRPALQRMRNTLVSTKRNRSAPMNPHNKPVAVWRVVTTWRNFPPALKQALATLASNEVLNVPLGELISELLRFGLQAYSSNLLVLEPVSKGDDSYTLFPKENDT